DEQEAQEIVTHINDGKTYQTEAMSVLLETEVFRLYTPLSINGIDRTWMTFLSVPIDEVMEKSKQITLIIITIAVFIIVVLAGIILLVTRNITNPITAVVAQGLQMSKGDFTGELPEKFTRRKDEIGDLAQLLDRKS